MATYTSLLAYLQSPLSWTAAIFGALIGSFLNVCIIRIPAQTFFKSQRSRCPHCDALIPFWHNIPVLSWLLLRGRARCCGKAISPQYILVELFTALLFVICYWQWPFVESLLPDPRFNPNEFIRFVHGVTFCSLLLVCTVIDYHLQIIPDVISLPMIAASPLVFAIHPELTATSSLLGILLGGGSLYAVAWIYFMLRGEAGLGMGDVKLLAGIGGWLGWECLPHTILIASLTGALVGVVGMVFNRQMNMRTALPFGPFLALGAFMHLICGQQIAEWSASLV